MFKLALLIVLLVTGHAFAQPSTVTPTEDDPPAPPLGSTAGRTEAPAIDPDSEIHAVGALRGGVTATKAHTNDDGEGDPFGTESGIGWVLGLEVGWGTARLMGVGYLDVAQTQVGSGPSSQQLTEVGTGMRFHRELVGGLYAGLGLGTELFSDGGNIVGGLAGVVDVHASYRIPGKIGLQLFVIGSAGYAPNYPLPPDEPAPSSWIVSARAELGLAF